MAEQLTQIRNTTESREVGFTPSPVAPVRLVDKEGKVVKVVPMNRRERRRRGIRRVK
jgi:hypothetical protein